jgi:murein endopeptidase
LPQSLPADNSRATDPRFLLAAAAVLFASCAPKIPVPQVVSPVAGSVGKPEAGSLVDGKRLESFPGAHVAEAERCWGTPEAVDLLEQAITETRTQFPDAPDVVIGDFSTQFGGRLYPHKSHQSGRDVDVGLYHRDGKADHEFRFTTVESLDVEKTWYLMETVLLTGRVEYIFLDLELQQPLYEYARQGYSEERLSEWFQFVHGRGERKGIIRHAGGHHDHMHIRFRCPESDRYCE